MERESTAEKRTAESGLFIKYEDDKGVTYRPVSKIARIRRKMDGSFEVMFDLGSDVERAILMESELRQRGTLTDFFG